MNRKQRNRGTSSDRGLPTPSDIASDPKAQEILSLWIIDGSPFCLIQVGWNNPAAWGLALADVARMIGNALRDSQGIDPKEAVTVLRELFNRELDQPTAETTGKFVDSAGNAISKGHS
jgi:hypothetical protein